MVLLAQLKLVLAHFFARQRLFWHSCNYTQIKKSTDKQLKVGEISLFQLFFIKEVGMEAALYLLAQRLSHNLEC